MTLDEIKLMVEVLPKDQRRELAIYLTHLELSEDSAYFETLRNRMNNQLEQAWTDLDELE